MTNLRTISSVRSLLCRRFLENGIRQSPAALPFLQPSSCLTTGLQRPLRVRRNFTTASSTSGTNDVDNIISSSSLLTNPKGIELVTTQAPVDENSRLETKPTKIHFVFESTASDISETERQKMMCEDAIKENLFKPKKSGSVFPIFDYTPTKATHPVCILVGLGKSPKDLRPLGFQKAVKALFGKLKELGIDKVSIDLGNFEKVEFADGVAPESNSESTLFAVRQFAEALYAEAYYLPKFKKELKEETFQLKEVKIDCTTDSSTSDLPTEKELQDTLDLTKALAAGQSLAKDLKNLPANVCSTQYMVDVGEKLASVDGELCKFSKLTDAEMRKLAMGCLTAVGQGSEMESYLGCLEYNGGPKDQKPILLVLLIH